jgi:hypothetical protein
VLADAPQADLGDAGRLGEPLAQVLAAGGVIS